MENRYCGACRGERGCADCKKAAKNAGYSGLTGFIGETGEPAGEAVSRACYFLAADVGTTTLAFVCADEAGRILSSYGCMNPQRRLAADVIGRVDHACRHGREELKGLIREALVQGFLFVLSEAEKKYGTARRVQTGIAGNTVMLHLLLDYPVEGLARTPFVPYRTEGVQMGFSELFWESSGNTGMRTQDGSRRLWEGGVVILPCFSAFVGADLFAGAYFVGFFEKGQKKTLLLADFGTNGELLLLHQGEVYGTAAAMGTAFEGGRFSYAADLFRMIARAWQEQKMDSYGLLEEPYFSEGFDGLLQEDIREFQLAKGAIRAGIELLCKRAGIGPSEVEAVYLAGGLGQFCAEEDMLVCGLLPQEFKGKIVSVGNSCIGGLVKYLTKKETVLTCKGTMMNLASEPAFKESYYSYMNFGYYSQPAKIAP